MRTHVEERLEDAERKAPRAAAAPPVQQILALQRSAGNGAVAAMLQRQETAEAEWTQTWTDAEAKAIQRELKRLNLYDKRIDGDIGPYSRAGLKEAFGGDEWQGMAADLCLERLKAATKVKAKGAGHDFEYGELFKDGILDVTFGMGYMEEIKGKYMGMLETEFDEAFTAKGYKNDPERSAQLLTAAGRSIGKDAVGKFWLKEKAMSYGPPAGEQRPVHVIVRFVSNPDGTKGKEAAGAFKDAMTQGDVAYYSGHGRYGSGPDFDRNFLKFTLKAKDGQDQEFDDYSVLEKALAKEGDPWTVFLKRYEDKTLLVDFSNAGNVRLNKEVHHGNEFGGKLIYWAMDKTGNAAVTGEGGDLDKGADATDRKYRLLVFDGCRTQDYEKAIRSTPGYDSKGADVIETKRTVGFKAEVEAFMAFLDGILGEKSAEQVIKDMDAQMRKHETGKDKSSAFKATGLEDNPTH